MLLFRLSLLVFAAFSSDGLTKPQVHWIGLASNFSAVAPNSYNPFGNSVRNGAELALDEVNKSFLNSQFVFKFKEIDYGDSSQRLLEETRKAVKGDLIAVVGYEYSDDALLAAPILVEAELPFITPSATSDHLLQFPRFVHMMAFPNSTQGKVLAKYAITELGATRAAVVEVADCAYCTNLSKAFQTEFRARGGKVVHVSPILSGNKSFDGVAGALKQLKPDVVLVPNQELQSGNIIRSLFELGIRGPFIGGDGWRKLGNQVFGKLSAPAFHGFTIAHWTIDDERPVNQSFVDKYQKRFKVSPTDSAALAYDSILWLGANLKKLNRINRANLEVELKKTQLFSGVTGQWTIDNGFSPQKGVILLKSGPNGFSKVKFVEPK